MNYYIACFSVCVRVTLQNVASLCDFIEVQPVELEIVKNAAFLIGSGLECS